MKAKLIKRIEGIIKGWKKCIATSNPSVMDYEMLTKALEDFILGSVPEQKKGIEIKGATVKCQFPNDCNLPICLCAEVIPKQNKS